MTFVANTLKSQRGNGGGGLGPEETLVAAPLSHGSNPNSNAAGRRREDDENIASVRRLMPVECERLQALPDNWTLLAPSTPDSRRYAALGDAVTATVGEWIGRRMIAA